MTQQNTDEFEKWFDSKLDESLKNNDGDMVMVLTRAKANYAYGWQAATARQEAMIADFKKAVNATFELFKQECEARESIEAQLTIAVEALEKSKNTAEFQCLPGLVKFIDNALTKIKELK